MLHNIAQGYRVECIVRKPLFGKAAREHFDTQMAARGSHGRLVKIDSGSIPTQFSHSGYEISGAATDIEQSSGGQMTQISRVGQERFAAPEQ
jgi:hypothetical protein